MNTRKLLFSIMSLSAFGLTAGAQQAYFVDGYHGGVYGHYPVGQTSFIVQELRRHPEWRINLEIEPETWDTVRRRDPEAYAAFRNLFADQSAANGRIEYVNPTYAQSYFFATSGESLIRQFTHGMRHLRKHFPQAVFTTYSAEEPCFTSCLPTVLRSLGFSYASTKNPNTMWGGYVSAFGGDVVNWLGPDGTALPTVPRYSCEALQPGSTWQSVAWFNSKDYVNKCLASGIQRPVGMCIQDASWSHGWDKGPWLGADTAAFYQPTRYVTWRGYMEQRPQTGVADWHFTQEDVRVSLMWGTQVMQRLAQEVRRAENRLVQAEKLAALAAVHAGAKWPESRFDEAWRTLLLSQHHDCWIVPYNRLQGKKTWAQHVTDWTDTTCRAAGQVSAEAMQALARADEAGRFVTVYNTQASPRKELVTFIAPSAWAGRQWMAVDARGRKHPTQWTAQGELMFRAEVPSVGCATYRMEESGEPFKSSLRADSLSGGRFLLESDLYAIVLNLGKGGCMESLRLKKAGHREMVDASSDRFFNELRGFFVDEGAFLSSTQHPATVRVLEQGPLALSVAVEGQIGGHPYTQTIRLVQGEERIDMRLRLDWKHNVHIGEPGVEFRAENPRKAFYDDRYKLLLHFPAAVAGGKVSKDAPFDVCQSRLDDTFYNRWDSIKHNIVVHWVDLASDKDGYGLALFSDHTTSYAHGKDFPLSLDVQYSGRGLWGVDYRIDGPTELSYAILPHRGDWRKARLWTRGEQMNEPLLAIVTGGQAAEQSFVSVEGNAYELSAMYCEGGSWMLRLFNAQGDADEHDIVLHGTGLSVELTELDGRTVKPLPVREKNGKSMFRLPIPRFGIRTLKVSAKP